jgi:hypothetical protein
VQGRALLVAVALAVTGCSSSPRPIAPATSTVPAPPTPSVDAVQHYLDQVNALCDALLPKVLTATHGGHDAPYPVREYFAEQPAHAKATDEFDVALGKIPAPPAAAGQQAALAAYIRFARRIDAARDAAAHRGQRAFDSEIRHERSVDLNSPTIAARDAAGFDDSCNAR